MEEESSTHVEWRKSSKRAWPWCFAVLVHIGLVFFWQGMFRQEKIKKQSTSESLSWSPVGLIYIKDDGFKGEKMSSVRRGVADYVGVDKNVSPGTIDSTGHLLGRAAKGQGGTYVISDRDDLASRSATPWNSAALNSIAHTGKASSRSLSPEALERSHRVGFSDRKKRVLREKKGQKYSSEGLQKAEGEGGLSKGKNAEFWASLDPRFDRASPLIRAQQEGAVERNKENSWKEKGSASTESAQKGNAADAFSLPLRSTQRKSSAFHLGSVSRANLARKKSVGAWGESGHSVGGGGESNGSASQNKGGTGKERGSTRASRSEPYFFSMYKKIDKTLRFPRELAVKLEQGESILRFSLDSKGRVFSLELVKSSGFSAFDTEALRAFRSAAPYGPPPKSLLNSQDRLVVLAPYFFRNSLIQ